MQTSLRTLLVLATLIALSATSVRATDPAANFIVKLFAAVCVLNMGQPDKVRDWASQKRLPTVSNPTARKVFMGEGDKGDAWYVPSQAGNFALSIRAATEACAVWAGGADPAESEALFRQIIEGVKRPGLEVTTLDEKKVPTPVGEALSLVYGVRATTEKRGFAFTLLTAENPGSSFQVSMQVARAVFK